MERLVSNELQTSLFVLCTQIAHLKRTRLLVHPLSSFSACVKTHVLSNKIILSLNRKKSMIEGDSLSRDLTLWPNKTYVNRLIFPLWNVICQKNPWEINMHEPGISNQTKLNQTSIKPNQTPISWVLNLVIKQNRTSLLLGLPRCKNL